MSDFHFDALRDPEAPIPGDHERGGVKTRAQQLRTRTRLNRLVAGAASLVVVAAIALAAVASNHDPKPEIAVPGSTTTVPTTSTTAGPSTDARFIPPTTVENGQVVLPVTLPDGAKFTVRYPPEMKIAELGFTGGIAVDWQAGPDRCCSSSAAIAYTTIERVYGDTKPIAVYRDLQGNPVHLYAVPYTGSQGPPSATQELAFQFGPWLVRVDASKLANYTQVPFTEKELSVWAVSFGGTVNAKGYLVLHTRAPLSLGTVFFGGFGPADSPSAKLGFDSYSACGHLLSPWSTPQQVGRGPFATVEWCVDKVLHVEAAGSPAFLSLALHDLKVSPLRPPGGAGEPPPAPATVVSASFTSADRGWLLEQNGAIANTIDGGRTWHAVATLGRPGSNMQIRFADEKHGFAFSGIPSDSAQLLTTDDGGNSWKSVSTPFAYIYDLEISRGVVRVVALQPGAYTFRLWSSPADQVAWTEDPLSFPAGAGPVASAQLVLSGERGWLVLINRVGAVVARMEGDGQWTKWDPSLCAGSPINLAASNETDLVALCTEGVYTGPRVTNAIYFSHDGGSTSERRSAPTNGALASPDAHTAVILIGNTLQRTTDDGATWQVVYSIEDKSGAGGDLGFTTPTQGFAILQTGAMLMTYDAGASWQPVTLP